MSQRLQSFAPAGIKFRLGNRLIEYDKPVVMGILNVTPDSFYAGSRTSEADAIAGKAMQMISEGADILDIGAYSSRPHAADVSVQEELRRLIHALGVVRRLSPTVLISIDTFRSEVLQTVVQHFGPVIVNDISGGGIDKAMFETVARLQLPYVLMHMQGTPQDMASHTHYPKGVVDSMMLYFSDKLSQLRRLGVADVWLDPGFGFAKTLGQNFEILASLHEFGIFELPLLVGLSRKSMVYKSLGVQPANALNGTTVLHTLALQRGAQILRVHDVREAVEAITLCHLTLPNYVF